MERKTFDLSGHDLFAHNSQLSCSYRPTQAARRFYQQVKDGSEELRSGNIYRNMRYAVFGLCNSLYKDNFNTVARNLNKWLSRKGRSSIAKSAVSDPHGEPRRNSHSAHR